MKGTSKWSNWGTEKRLRRVTLIALATSALFSVRHANAQPDTTESLTRVPVVFSGGYETDPRDRGRPVVLIAGALGVQPDVFREAFSHVHPAPAGTEPDPAQVRQNKEALMSALGRYGISNERLDTVSNYYRYNRSRGEMWPTKTARALALVRDGTVTGFIITDGGAGYSSPPRVDVPGVNSVRAKADLSFSKTFTDNGSVKAITIAGENAGRVLPKER